MKVLVLLAVPAWLYLWLGSETSPARVLVFLAGYLVLGVALTRPPPEQRPDRSTDRSSRPRRQIT